MPNSTPFAPIHKRLGAVFADYDEWHLPAHYGDPDAESAALYNNTAVFDLSSFGRITIKGQDSSKLIETLIAGSTEKLTEAKWIWAIIYDEQGNLADIVRITKLASACTILTSPPKRQQILNIAQKCAAEYSLTKTKITDITEKTAMLAFHGPETRAIIDKILPFDLASIEKHSIQTFSVLMISATIIRTGLLGIDGLEMICPASVAPMAAGAITRYRDRYNIIPAGMDCLQTAMLEASLPFSITNSPEAPDLTTTALHLSHMINFDKDFFGKQQLQQKANTAPEKILVGLTTPLGPKTHNNMKIQHDDRQIGWSPKLVPSTHLNKAIALAIIDSEFSNLTDQVQIVSEDIITPAQITPLPFDKNITPPIYNFD